MRPRPPTTRTFADIEREGLEIVVTCQKCGHRAVVDSASPSIRNRPIAGRRFRCGQLACGGIGLPTIGKQRRWPARLADHASKLRGPK